MLGEVLAVIAVFASLGDAERIVGGTAASTCAWANVVMVETTTSLCSGTLVDPNIVVYAAHCGADVQAIYFGENVASYVAGEPLTLNAPTLTALPQRCRLYPGHDPINGTDFAYCTLARPVTQVPIVPILMGCEAAVLHPGRTVVLVGFGEDDAQQVGQKHVVRTLAQRFVANKALLGGDGADACLGDSGGPAFVQLATTDALEGHADSTWRVFGLTSYGIASGCGSGTYFSLLATGVPWIEADSGMDITPCTDAHGTWMPGPRCGHFPTNLAGGTWADNCAGVQRGGASATCGEPYWVGPAVQIIEPTTTAELVAGEFNVVVRSADATSVSAVYDQQAVAQRSHVDDTYTFGPMHVSPGDHSLIVTASDANGTTDETVSLHAGFSQVEGGGGGCTAVGGNAWGGIAALFVVFLRRRRRGALLALLSVMLVSCGVHRDVRLQIQNETFDSVGNHIDAAASAQVAAIATLPAPGAAISGTVSGYPIGTTAVYTYGANANHTSLLITLSDQNNLCELINDNRDTPADHALTLQLVTLATDADEPLKGTFQVVAPEAPVSTPGNYALVHMTVNDANCSNSLGEAQSWGQSGAVVIDTVVTNAGVYVQGTLQGISMGVQGDVIAGPFVGADCALDEGIPAQSTCR